SALEAVGYRENERFTPLAGMAGGTVRAMVAEGPDSLWIANINGGLFHTLRGTVPRRIPWTGLGHRDFATALATDPRRGGVWLGFSDGGIAYFKDGQVRESYSARVVGA